MGVCVVDASVGTYDLAQFQNDQNYAEVCCCCWLSVVVVVVAPVAFSSLIVIYLCFFLV